MRKRGAKKAGKTIRALVLAAGSSRRMGAKNKLLLRVNGIPMVTSVVCAALASKVESVLVVTGFEAHEVQQALKESSVGYVHNRDYASGIASSLRAGLRALPQDTDGVLIMLADMPFVESGQINALIDEFTRASDDVIVVPVFGGRPGNPRLWARRYFEAMCACDGDVGARHLIKKFSAQVRRVAMNDTQVLTDIDTPAEWARLTKRLAKEGGDESKKTLDR